MLRFYALPFVAAFNNLMVVEAVIPIRALSNREGTDWPAEEQRLKDALLALGKECDRLPLSKTVRWQIQRVAEQVRVSAHDVVNHATLARLTEIRKNLMGELSDHLFYVVPEKWAELMDAGIPAFGQEVAVRFREARQDIAAAGRCFALDEWTACVFHCMRALELGLHAFAAHLGVTMTTPIELENWKNIIDLIEKEIRKLEALPKGADKSEKLRQYSDAASQFRYFKDAWRNHVSHARVPYDSREAETVWNHTRDFMQALVEIV